VVGGGTQVAIIGPHANSSEHLMGHYYHMPFGAPASILTPLKAFQVGHVGPCDMAPFSTCALRTSNVGLVALLPHLPHMSGHICFEVKDKVLFA
jgi:hypothetical protein